MCSRFSYSHLTGARSRRRSSKSMVNWFRRRGDGNNGGEHERASHREARVEGPRKEEHQDATPLEVEPQTAEDLVDRTPEPQEPADGLSEAGIREALRAVAETGSGRERISPQT